MFKLITAVSAALVLSSTATAVDWDMPTPYSDATFHTANIIEFAKDVSASTEGKLNIQVHSAGSLIKHAEIKNAVRSQQVPLGEFFLSRLSNENPAFGIDSQPFYAASYAEAERLWQAQKPVVTALLAKQRLMPLFSVPWPPQGLYTVNKIESTDDLKGLKFRAYNASLERFAQQVGASPTQVEAADIAQAFSTGQIEAMITSPSTGANSKAWDFVSHYSPINAWVPKNIVVVNKRAFDALDAEVQAAVLAAAERAETRGWEMSKEETASKVKALADNGMVVEQPSEALMAGLKAVGADMQVEWQKTATAETKAITNAFQP